MNKALSDLLTRAASWPAEAQDELERLAREIEAEIGAGAYRPTPEELAGINRGLSDVAAGHFATAEEVEAVFAKHRRP
jgi:predicted transcriptional regulator